MTPTFTSVMEVWYFFGPLNGDFPLCLIVTAWVTDFTPQSSANEQGYLAVISLAHASASTLHHYQIPSWMCPSQERDRVWCHCPVFCQGPARSIASEFSAAPLSSFPDIQQMPRSGVGWEFVLPIDDRDPKVNLRGQRCTQVAACEPNALDNGQGEGKWGIAEMLPWCCGWQPVYSEKKNASCVHLYRSMEVSCSNYGRVLSRTAALYSQEWPPRRLPVLLRSLYHALCFHSWESRSRETRSIKAQK